MERPDVLVLGAGGTVGAAWMGGVLAGLAAATGIDFAAVEHLVGTSAGAIVAADLLAGEEPRGPTDGAPAELPDTLDDPAAAAAAENGALRARAGRLGAGLASAAGSSLAPLALSLGRAPGTLARAAALARVESPDATLDDLGARIARHGLEWDGRLRIVCVDRARGRRVVFGAPGAPDATVAEAVQASCSIPWAYRPVRIGADEYVDGAVWSPTNMDAAPGGRETHLLCLAPMAGHLGTRERSATVRAATTAAIGIETAALRRRGAIVQVVAPEPVAPGEHVRAAGFRQGRALARAR
jgi:NTE family protein